MLTKLLMLYLILPVLSDEDERVITSLNFSPARVQPTSVRGRIAPKELFSYLVSIKRSFQRVTQTKYLWSTYCGGSVIHPTKVLTAAHCFDMKEFYYYTHFDLLRCVVGSNENNIQHEGFTTDSEGQQWRQITSVLLHPDFLFPINDIAVLKVDLPFDFHRIISYYHPHHSDTDYEGNDCFTAGFGQIGIVPKEKVSKHLLWADIHVLSKKRCTGIWGMNMDKFVCSDTIFSDISGGDSGGPLVCRLSTKQKKHDPNDNRNYVLVGIASGKNSDKTRLYTRVQAFQNWLDGGGPTFRATSSAWELEISRLLLFICIVLIKFICTCFECVYCIA